MPSVEQKLHCAGHGETTWSGDVVCSEDAGGCGRVYQTGDEKGPMYAPKLCTCGKQLMVEDGYNSDNWTARAICHDCFLESARKQAN